MPEFQRELAGHERGAAPLAIIQDFQEVPILGFLEFLHAPVVNDQQGRFLELSGQAEEAAVGMSRGQLPEQLGRHIVPHPMSIPAGFLSQGTGQESLSRTGGSRHDYILMIPHPLGVGQLVKLGAFQSTGRLEVNILETGRHLELGLV